MEPRSRAPLLALSALLLLLTSPHIPASQRAPPRTNGHAEGLTDSTLTQVRSNSSHGSGPPKDLQSNSSRSPLSQSGGEWGPETGVSPVCAYRVIDGGIGGQLCFRHTLFGFRCHKQDCGTVVSAGSLVANILTNGSVLLQWSHHVPNSTRDQPGAVGTRHRRRGYELSCWWNGSYTQFECAGVHLGSGCRDFLLAELHQNFPYRFCLRSLDRRDEQRDCVHFTLPPSGMQDIVIAMTTVGGAICVMLVIICLLVAYITENIMSPATQHAHSYRTHSHH